MIENVKLTKSKLRTNAMYRLMYFAGISVSVWLLGGMPERDYNEEARVFFKEIAGKDFGPKIGQEQEPT